MKNAHFALLSAIMLISMSTFVFAIEEGESEDLVKQGGPFRKVSADAPQVPSYSICEAKKTIKILDADKRQERKEKIKRNAKLVKDIYEGVIFVDYAKDHYKDPTLIPDMEQKLKDSFGEFIHDNIDSYTRVEKIIIDKPSVIEFGRYKYNDFITIYDNQVGVNGTSYKMKNREGRSNEEILKIKNQSIRLVYFNADVITTQGAKKVSFLLNPKFFSFDVDDEGNIFLSKMSDCVSKFFSNNGDDTFIVNKEFFGIDSTWVIFGKDDEKIGYLYVGK